MPKAARFLLSLVIWAGLLFVFYILLIPGQEDTLSSFSLNRVDYILKHLFLTFKYADGWNILLITFLISLSAIIFSINDIFITDRIFKKLTLKAKGFYQEGFTWLIKMLSNSVILFIQLIVICYIVNIFVSSPSIFYSTTGIPKAKYTALVLGTSKYIIGTKTINTYYQTRVNATLELYRNGLIERIIISGDRKDSNYDETREFQDDLTAAGIPAKIMVKDTKGFSTIESIKRAKLFNSNLPLIIVSQAFHLERAIFLAKHEGIEAIGYSAGNSMTANMLKRELFAKVKVLMDLYVFNSQAEGVSVFPRRKLSLFKTTDLVLMLFCLGCVSLAGVLVRNLTKF